jgi:DNA-binding response OmpR family regulator
MARERILVVDKDIDSLSKIYLAFVQRSFKVEACDNPEKIKERIKKFRPAVIVLQAREYKEVMEKLKIPAIVLAKKEEEGPIQLNDGDVLLHKPVQANALTKAIEKLI